MRLIDLDPRYFERNSSRVGITFECPHCFGKETASRLAVALHMDGTNWDPDPDNPQQFETGDYVWTIAGGASFHDLSLSPSIDASSSGHWHGLITAGEIVGGLP